MGKFMKSIVVSLLILLFFLGNVYAEKIGGHRLVIQVSTDDAKTQKVALNNAVNLQRLYGKDNVTIEIVAYGPGLGLLTKKSGQASRVESLAMQDITFSACQNTMNYIKNKTGKLPVLLEGVETVNNGVARIMVLQEQGYAYIRP